ncbi:MAG: ATP-binding protein [Planctomycetota bacterium]
MSGAGDPGPEAGLERLRFAEVPAEVAPVFEQAGEIVDRLFSQRVATPEEATFSVAGERYLLVRAASISVHFYEVIRLVLGARLSEPQALLAARELLYDLAHAIGRADARSIHAQSPELDPVARLALGPSHFAHTGWGRVRIRPESELEGDVVLHYDHLHSFEADAHLRAGRQAAEPACVMNAGYSAGWCTESFGLQLDAAEVTCRACGGADCRFVMAPPGRLAARVAELEDRLGIPLAPPPPHAVGLRTLDKLSEAEAARDRSLASLRSLFEHAPFGAFLLERGPGQDVVIADVNAAADAILGVSCKEMVGGTLQLHFPQAEATGIAQVSREVLDGQRGPHHDARLAYDDGVVRGVFDFHVFPFQPGRVAALFHDVTEQARAEEADRAAERLEATATLAGGIAHDFNNLMAGVIGHVAFLRRGRPGWEETDEVLGRVEQAALRAGDLSQQLLSYAQGGKYADEPLRLNSLVEGVVRDRSAEAGVVLGLHAVRDQVTGDPAQLRQLVWALVQNALEASREGGQVRVSTFGRGLQQDEAQALQLPPGSYVVLEVQDTGAGMSAEVLARAFEPYFSTKAPGRGLGLAAAYGILKNHGGTVELESAPGMGTTARAFLPRAGSRRHRPLEQRAGARQGWVERQGSLEAIGSLALGLASDLHYTLGVAAEAHQEASTSEDAGRRQAACTRATEALERCRQLTDRLLAMGRGSRETRRRASLVEVVREVALLLAPALGPRVELKLELEEGLPECSVARAQLADALVNLVFNGRDALPEGQGRITIAAGRAPASEAPGPGDWARLEVRDTGVGMPEHLRGKAREPFFTTKDGSGIGLAMADRVVRSHGGELLIASAPGQGTRVALLLPLGAPPSPPPVAQASRVLIVDDNEHVARSTAQLLRLEGLDAVEAGSGEEALALFEAGERFDVVLLDLVLPGISGPETFHALRQRAPEQAVVVFSGYGEQARVQDLKAAGAVFLGKPFSVEELLGALGRAQGQGSGGA